MRLMRRAATLTLGSLVLKGTGAEEAVEVGFVDSVGINQGEGIHTQMRELLTYERPSAPRPTIATRSPERVA